MIIGKFSQELVEATSKMLNGRIINIMDTRGIIVASSEQHRVGSFHQGAFEVIKTGRIVKIYRNDVETYKGAKEGYNMPINCNGEIIGVVGIFGDPEYVEDTAKVLAVYVEEHFKYLAQAKKEQLEEEIRINILKLLIYSNKESIDKVGEMITLISCEIKLPVRVLVINIQDNNTNQLEKLRQLSQIRNVLVNELYLNKSHDIYGIINEQLIVIKGVGVKKKNTIQSIADRLYKIQGIQPVMMLGSLCEELTEISDSYKEANYLYMTKGENIQDIDNADCTSKYLIHCIKEGQGKRYAVKMYKSLRDFYSEKEFVEIVRTIEIYNEVNGSITKTAEIMRVHKNTIVYRMKKIFEVLNLEDANVFTKRFFLMLFLDYYHFHND